MKAVVFWVVVRVVSWSFTGVTDVPSASVIRVMSALSFPDDELELVFELVPDYTRSMPKNSNLRSENLKSEQDFDCC